MRTIDADALLKTIEEVAPDHRMTFGSLVSQAPTIDALPVTAAELKHLINDVISYIWGLEDRGEDKPEFGYDSRKALLEKLEKFEKEHFHEAHCCG